MESTSSNMLVDIAATSKKHGPVISQLLAAHAILGCDTVGQLYGIGKVTVIKALLWGHWYVQMFGPKNGQAKVNESTLVEVPAAN